MIPRRDCDACGRSKPVDAFKDDDTTCRTCRVDRAMSVSANGTDFFSAGGDGPRGGGGAGGAW